MAKGKTNKTSEAGNTTEQAPATEAPAAVARIQQNGITRPKEGTTTGRVWAIADEISAQTQKPAERGAVVEQGVSEKINASTCATQYGKWRKFHGLTGENAPGRSAKPAAEATPEAPAAPAAPVAEAPVAEAPAAYSGRGNERWDRELA